MDKLFIDINVILDVAVQREPYFKSSQNLLTYIAQGKAHGYCSALTYSILYYLIKKQTNHHTAMHFIQDMLELFVVVDLNKHILRQALQTNLNDYEDSIQVASAQNCGATCIITRNIKDYKKIFSSCFTPEEYLAEI